MRLPALGVLAALAFVASPGEAEPLRIATYNPELTRSGPGLLLRDIRRGEDPQVLAAAAVIAEGRPDILLLTGFDYDLTHLALDAFAEVLEQRGLVYPHRFALRPNTGMATGLDMDGDGRTGGPRDAQGYGRFAGADGMAVLSRFPLAAAEARDFSAFLWRDLPGALLPEQNGSPFPSAAVQGAQRLSTTAHWDVPVLLPGGRLHLLAFYATPPVFDGPEDRNGRRNHDEVMFWRHYLDGALPWPPPDAPFVILGDANLDPFDGDGRGVAMRALLADPRLQDTAPASTGGAMAAAVQGGPNARHRGDPALDTADWHEAARDGGPGPGNMRVDYVLPSAGLRVTGAGVHWPAGEMLPDPPAERAPNAPRPLRHHLVWVDIDWP